MLGRKIVWAACVSAAALLTAVLAGCSASSVTSGSRSSLGAGQSLGPGEHLSSDNQLVTLTMQDDGNVILAYEPLAQNDPWRANLTNFDTDCDSVECLLKRPRTLWASGTSGYAGAVLFVTAEGDVQIRQGTETVWSSGTSGNPGSTLQLLDTGNAVVMPPESKTTESQSTAREASRHPSIDSIPVSASSSLPLWATGTSVPTFTGSGLASGDTLASGQYLQSSGGSTELSMSPNGTLALFNLTADACPMWVQPALSWVPVGQRGQDGDEYGARPVANSALHMQSDGNLVLTTPQGAVVWASNTSGNDGATLDVQDDGNLVIYSASGDALWSTGSQTYLGSSLCKGEQMSATQVLLAEGFEDCGDCGPQGEKSTRLVFANDAGKGAELDIVADNGGTTHIWRDQSAPSDVYLVMQDDGNLVVYPAGSSDQGALWASGSQTPGAFAALSLDGCLAVMTYAWDGGEPGDATNDGNLTYEVYWSSCPDNEAKMVGKSQKLTFASPS